MESEEAEGVVTIIVSCSKAFDGEMMEPRGLYALTVMVVYTHMREEES